LVVVVKVKSEARAVGVAPPAAEGLSVVELGRRVRRRHNCFTNTLATETLRLWLERGIVEQTGDGYVLKRAWALELVGFEAPGKGESVDVFVATLPGPFVDPDAAAVTGHRLPIGVIRPRDRRHRAARGIDPADIYPPERKNDEA
jgi:hypothetical protein